MSDPEDGRRMFYDSDVDDEKMEESLLVVVRSLKTPTESIWSWNLNADGTATGLLIEEAEIRQARNFEAIGLPGGMGRGLQFERRDGAWCFAGESRWIG